VSRYGLAALVALVPSALLLVIAGAYGLVRALLGWRQARRQRQEIQAAQREAESRDSLRPRRESAKRALMAPEWSNEPVSQTITTINGWTVTAHAACNEDRAYVVGANGSAVRVDFEQESEGRSHPLGWTTVGLQGGVLCAAALSRRDRHGREREAWLVDRFDVPSCAWVRVPPDDPLHAAAVEALQGRA